jgi:hypothetical protein
VQEVPLEPLPRVQREQWLEQFLPLVPRSLERV